MACFIKCTLIKKSNYEAKPEIMSCLTKYSATLSDTDITYGVNANIFRGRFFKSPALA